MAKKKETSSQRQRRLSKERTAKQRAAKASKIQGSNTRTFLSGLGDMLWGDKKGKGGGGKGKPSAKPPKPPSNSQILQGQRYRAPQMGRGSNMGQAGRLATRGGPLVRQGSSALARVGPGLASRLGPPAMAIAGGALAGKWAEKNWDKGVSTSGRGSGRKAFEEGNKKRDKAANPPKAKNPGPKAVEGGYTISKKTRQQLQSERIKKKQQADIDAFNKAKQKNSTKLKQQQESKVKPTKPVKPTVRPSAGNGGGGNKPAKPAKPAKAAPKRDRMSGASSDSRMAAWAKANRKMIEKSGTRKQRQILRKALGSNANQRGWPGNRNT